MEPMIVKFFLIVIYVAICSIYLLSFVQRIKRTYLRLFASLPVIIGNLLIAYIIFDPIDEAIFRFIAGNIHSGGSISLKNFNHFVVIVKKKLVTKYKLATLLNL